MYLPPSIYFIIFLASYRRLVNVSNRGGEFAGVRFVYTFFLLYYLYWVVAGTLLLVLHTPGVEYTRYERGGRCVHCGARATCEESMPAFQYVIVQDKD